jgi:dTDP-glucose 4,6-dehydratase
MNILITGSRGTLGRVLKAELIHRGHTVYGVDLQHSGDPTEIRADVADYRQLENVFREREIDIVYHLAAEFGRVNGAEYYEQLWRTNQIGTQNVIRLCVRHKVRMILAGSSEAYGDAKIPDTNDAFALPEKYLDTYAPLHHNEYALSKWAQERQVFIAAQNEGLKAVVLRFFNAYGPGEYYSPYRSVVCLFCYRMLFGLPVTVYKNYHRVFMWVGDWARTVANVADRFDDLPRESAGRLSTPANVPVYNIGGEEYRSVEELAGIVLKTIRKTGGTLSNNCPITFVDKEAANVTNKLPDITLAKRDLAHRPRVTLDQGIPDTIVWMRTVYTRDGQLGRDTTDPLQALGTTVQHATIVG